MLLPKWRLWVDLVTYVLIQNNIAVRSASTTINDSRQQYYFSIHISHDIRCFFFFQKIPPPVSMRFWFCFLFFFYCRPAWNCFMQLRRLPYGYYCLLVRSNFYSISAADLLALLYVFYLMSVTIYRKFPYNNNQQNKLTNFYKVLFLINLVFLIFLIQNKTDKCAL